MVPWPHQLRAVEAVLAAIAQGQRRIVLAAPTGAGKTLVMEMLIRRHLEAGQRVVLYSNRIFLIEQLSQRLLDSGLYHGIRSSGGDGDIEHPLQISSIATEHSRVVKKQTMQLHAADLVLVDEGHLHTGPTAQEIFRRHHEQGAAILFVTATPLGMAEVADVLLQPTSMQELRDCGALVEAHHYGPDEPDFRAFKELRKKLESGENASEAQLAKAYPQSPELFGRVWSWFQTLNSELRPTILFGPSLEGSIWFAEQFTARGIRAAHMDGEHVWLDGELHRTSSALREEIRGQSRDGLLRVVCNRFVLREGVDWPWLSHAILPAIGGGQSYLQAGGRLLRSYPGKPYATIQDHGGNWHRHGSLNEDRAWELDLTATMLHGLRASMLRRKQKPEPFRCPKCGRIWGAGRLCNPARGGCGHELPEREKRSRPVVSVDGQIKELKGAIFKPRRICQKPEWQARWEKMYWRSRTVRGTRTFQAAFALFAQENYWQWPDPAWPYMPLYLRDEFRLVKDVPLDRLVPKEGVQQHGSESEAPTQATQAAVS